MGARASRLLPMIAVCALPAGCASVRQHPVSPMPVVLVSSEPFDVHLHAAGDAPATTCSVKRLRGTVQGMRADTLHLASATRAIANKRLPDCLQGRAGYIDLSAHPDVRVETTELQPGRSLALALVLFPFAVFVGLGLALAH